MDRSSQAATKPAIICKNINSKILRNDSMIIQMNRKFFEKNVFVVSKFTKTGTPQKNTKHIMFYHSIVYQYTNTGHMEEYT